MTLPQLRFVLLILALAAGLAALAAPAGAAPPRAAGPTPTALPPGGGQPTPPANLPDGSQYGLDLAVAPAYGGLYRPGGWLPVRVDLANTGTDRAVEVRVGHREGPQYAAQVDLPNGARKSVTVYVYLPGSQRRLLTRVIGDGLELAAQNVDLRPSAVRARVVGLLTNSPLQPPARLPDGTPVVGAPLTPASFPEHPLGLSSFDTIVIDDMATSELGEQQLAALEGWVLRGGQLLLGGGAGLERSLAGLPAPMRIGELASVESLPASALLGAAGESAPDLPLARLSPQPDAGGRWPYAAPTAGLAEQGRSLLIEQTYGRGTLSIFAAPLGHPALLGWPDADRLWADLLRSPVSLFNGFAPDGSADSFLETNLAAALTGLPALELPSLLVIGGLIAVYVLVVGPGVYLLLRRLDRQALGWVVVPLVTLVFAAAAYGIGYAQRGGDLLINQISLVEDFGGSTQTRMRSFAGLFSPSRSSYVLEVAAGAEPTPLLLRPVAVQGFDGGGSSSVFVQDGANRAQARDLQIAQWSMRAVGSDSLAPASGLDARVIVDGDSLRGEVANRGDRPLLDVALIQGDRVARLGDIAPGETRSGELVRRGNAGMMGFGGGTPISYLIYADEIDRNSQAGGLPLPPELQQRQRLLDALFAYGPAPRDGQPTLFAWGAEYAPAVTTVGQRAQLQETALIVAQPRVELASGAVELPQGWLTQRIENSQLGPCFGALGTGIMLGAEPTVLQLSLPRDLYGLRPSELTLLTGADNAWPADTTLELYNWASGEWVAQPAEGQPLVVAEPERFLGSHGRMRVRVSSSFAQPSFGCIYVDASLKGSLQ